VTALVHGCGDVDGLASAIETLASDVPLRTRMGEAACRVSEGQTAPAAAKLLTEAAKKLAEMGPRPLSLRAKRSNLIR
jgi:hypothetical protein